MSWLIILQNNSTGLYCRWILHTQKIESAVKTHLKSKIFRSSKKQTAVKNVKYFKDYVMVQVLLRKINYWVWLVCTNSKHSINIITFLFLFSIVYPRILGVLSNIKLRYFKEYKIIQVLEINDYSQCVLQKYKASVSLIFFLVS